MKKTTLLGNILPVHWIVILVFCGLSQLLLWIMAGRLVYVVAKDNFGDLT